MSRWYDIDGKPISVMDAELLLADQAARQVGITQIGGATVSTVLLVLDHNFGDGPPQIFETAVWVHGESPDMEIVGRWSTKDEAATKHQEVVDHIFRERFPSVYVNELPEGD